MIRLVYKVSHPSLGSTVVENGVDLDVFLQREHGDGFSPGKFKIEAMVRCDSEHSVYGVCSLLKGHTSGHWREGHLWMDLPSKQNT